MYSVDLPAIRVSDDDTSWRSAAMGLRPCPSREIASWFTEQGLFLDYDRLDGADQLLVGVGGDKTCRAFRFYFEEGSDAVMFKLAWGGA